MAQKPEKPNLNHARIVSDILVLVTLTVTNVQNNVKYFNLYLLTAN